MVFIFVASSKLVETIRICCPGQAGVRAGEQKKKKNKVGRTGDGGYGSESQLQDRLNIKQYRIRT